MNPVEVRNAIVFGLHAYTGRHVVLSDQVVAEADYPYIYYQFITPLMPLGGANISFNGTSLTRSELTDATLSINACSADHGEGDTAVSGDDEALQLCAQAIGWFLHVGQPYLLQNGIVVVEAQNAQNRTAIEVDEVVRRYGFDVRLRFERQDTRTAASITSGTIINN